MPGSNECRWRSGGSGNRPCRSQSWNKPGANNGNAVPTAALGSILTTGTTWAYSAEEGLLQAQGIERRGNACIAGVRSGVNGQLAVSAASVEDCPGVFFVREEAVLGRPLRRFPRTKNAPVAPIFVRTRALGAKFGAGVRASPPPGLHQSTFKRDGPELTPRKFPTDDTGATSFEAQGDGA